MNFGLDLNLNVGLEQRLSPQMIQSLKLLQMNSMELEMVVKQELEANPMLETTEDGEDPGDDKEGEESPEAESEAEPGGEDGEPAERTPPEEEPMDRVIAETPEANKEIDWDSYLEEGFDPGGKRNEEMEHPDEWFEKVPVYAKSLQDHLID